MFHHSLQNLRTQKNPFARVKRFYHRITMTRWTTMYFFQALVTGLILVILQSVILRDNRHAVSLLNELTDKGNVTRSLVVLDIKSKQFKTCPRIPDSSFTNCLPLQRNPLQSQPLFQPNASRPFDFSKKRAGGILPVAIVPGTNPSGAVIGVFVSGIAPFPVFMDQTCLQSTLWLEHIVHNALREDIVTIIFEIWLFTVSLMAIIKGSLPHLLAAMAAHLLGPMWASTRTARSNRIEYLYRNAIIGQTCPSDFLGLWWLTRRNSEYIKVAINGAAFLTAAFLTCMLYKVYAKQSISRVGASPGIRRLYKLVLLLSALLQLAGFFVLAATGLWLDKVNRGVISGLARHRVIYTAVFSGMAVLTLPWLCSGWVSVRKEMRKTFWAHAFISVIFLAASVAVYSSPLYRYIFMDWPFFATVTVSSFSLIAATGITSVICRLNFGKGLRSYLAAESALEGMDFTPVIFPDGDGPDDNYVAAEKFSGRKHDHLASVHFAPHAPWGRGRVSVYSDPSKATVKLSSTPAVARGSVAMGRKQRYVLSEISTISTLRTPNLGSPANVRAPKWVVDLEKSGAIR